MRWAAAYYFPLPHAPSILVGVDLKQTRTREDRPEAMLWASFDPLSLRRARQLALEEIDEGIRRRGDRSRSNDRQARPKGGPVMIRKSLLLTLAAAILTTAAPAADFLSDYTNRRDPHPKEHRRLPSNRPPARLSLRTRARQLTMRQAQRLQSPRRSIALLLYCGRACGRDRSISQAPSLKAPYPPTKARPTTNAVLRPNKAAHQASIFQNPCRISTK
jgi:hypothetical protein